MGIFEDMGFSGNFEFLSDSMGCGAQEVEHKPVGLEEDDYSDEEMDVEELERRMWRDRMLLRRLKEKNKNKVVGMVRSSVSRRSRLVERRCRVHKMVY